MCGKLKFICICTYSGSGCFIGTNQNLEIIWHKFLCTILSIQYSEVPTDSHCKCFDWLIIVFMGSSWLNNIDGIPMQFYRGFHIFVGRCECSLTTMGLIWVAMQLLLKCCFETWEVVGREGIELISLGMQINSRVLQALKLLKCTIFHTWRE